MATINNDYQTRLLFKQYAGVAAVKLNQPFSDENFRFIPNLFSDDVMIEDIADSAPIGIGELDLSGSWLDSSYNYSNLSAFTPSVYNGPGENNGKSFSQIYPNSKVEFYKNLPLMPVSASANSRVWGFFTDWPTNKQSGLKHSMPFKFDDVLSTYLPTIKYNKIISGVGAGTGTANFTENYINAAPLYWLVDHGTGYVQMYGTTVDLSNAGVKAINDASGHQDLEWAPKMSIFKYNGKLGVLDLDISGQVQVPQIAANTLLQRQVLADGSANILDLCGNDAIRTQYNYVRKHMFVGYPTQPVIVNSMVDHLQDPSFNHPGVGDNFKYVLDVSGTTRLGGQAGGSVDLCGNLNFGFITNAIKWPKLPGNVSSRTWQIIGDQAQAGVLDIQYDANADSGIPDSLDHTLMRFDGASGYVGIGDISGTKRPAAELHIMGAVDRSSIMMDSDPSATMQCYISCYEPGQWMNIASKKSILFHTEYDNAVTGGQTAMWIDVCGNIGMGTYPNIPKRQLQIHDDVSQNTFLQVTNPATGYTSNEGGFQFGIDGSGVGKIIQGENKPITFYTNNDRRMEIDQDGNVGIGAYDNYGAGIGGRLHVNTQTNNDTVVRIENSSGAATLTTKKDEGNLEIGTTQTDSDIIIIPIRNTIIQQGNVGIADGSEPLFPTGKLHIAGDSRTSTPFLRLKDISDNYIFDQYIGMGHTGANRGVFDLANTGYGEFVFKDSVHDALMYISAGGGGVAPGGVGIGTLTPQRTLDVSGQIRLSTSDAAYKATLVPQVNSLQPFKIDVQGGRVFSYGDNTADKYGVVYINAPKEAGPYRGVAFQYNDSTKMYVDGINGYVGIGTMDPSLQLHVYKETGEATAVIGSGNGARAVLVLDGASNGDATGGNYSYFAHDADGVLRILNIDPVTTARPIALGTAAQPSKVGIGTASPSGQLHVAGSSNPTVIIGNNGTDTTGGTSTLKFHAADGTVGNAYEIVYHKLGAGVDRLTFTDGGLIDVLTLNNGGSWPNGKPRSNVGIRTNTPQFALDVSGGIRLDGWAGGSYVDGGLHFDLSGSHDFTIQEKEADVVSFGPSGNEIFSVNISSGDFCIGAVPGYSGHSHKFEVYNGQIRVLQSDAEIQISDNTPTGTLDGTASVVFEMGNAVAGKITAGRDGVYTGGTFTNSHLKFYTANTNVNVERMRIDASGHVGIGTIDSSAQLHVKAMAGAYTYEWERSTVPNTVRGTIDNIHGGTQKIFLSNHARDDNYPIGYSWSVGANRTITNFEIDPSGDAYFNAGRVGIGTSDPSYALHIEYPGNAQIALKSLSPYNRAMIELYGLDSGIRFFDSTSSPAESIAGIDPRWVFGKDNTDNSIKFSSGSRDFGTNDRLTILPDGNVIIRDGAPGAADADANLHIEATTLAKIQLHHTGSQTLTISTNDGMGKATIYSGNYGGPSTGAALSIQPNGDTWLARQSGNVGIGNSAPTHRLDVSGAGTAEETVMQVYNRLGVRQVWSTSTTSAYLTVGDGSVTPTGGAAVSGLTNRSLSLGVNDQACIHFWNGWPSASVKMSIDPSGYVGIFAHSIQHSTDACLAPLHIRDASGIGSQIRVENNNPGGECRMRFRAKNAANTDELHADIGVYCTGAATAGEEGFLGFKVPFNNTTGVGYKMIIDHTGNVGIGTTDPGTVHGVAYGTTRLHIDGKTDRGQIVIEGDTLASVIFSDNSHTANERVFINLVQDGIYSIKSLNDDGTGGPGLLSMMHSGNVGIGTPTPTGTLEIQSSVLTEPQLFINCNYAGVQPGQLIFLHGRAEKALSSGDELGNIIFQGFDSNDGLQNFAAISSAAADVTAGSASGIIRFTTWVDGSTDERMRIHSNGNVGIGTDAPGSKLDISYNGGFTTGLRVLSSSHHRAKLLVQDYNTSAYFIAEANVVSIGGRDAAHADNVNINTTTGVVGIGEITPSNGAMIGINNNKDAYLCGTNVKNLNTGVSAAAGSYWQSDGGTIDIRITGSNWGTQPLGAHGYLNVSSASHLALKHDGGTCLVVRSTEGNRVGIGGQFNADGQYPKTTLEVIGPSVGDGTSWANSPLYLYRMNTIVGGLDNLIKFGVGTDHASNGSFVMLGQDASNNFTIHTWSGSAHTHRFGIDSAGNVGIGMDSSGIETRLDVDGNFQIDSIRNDYGGFRITDDTVGDYNTNFLMGRGGDSGGFRFYTNYRPWATTGAWGTGNKKHIMSILGSGLVLANGTLRTEDGTMTDPVITFEADQDTGIFRPAANQLAITCSGETVMVCSNDPVRGRTVDICGNVSFDLDNLDISGALNINTGQLFIKGGAGQSEIVLEAPTGGHKGYINIDNSGNMELVSGAGKELQFHVDVPLVGSGGIEAMVIDPSGNVGIGTAASSYPGGPVAPLHIEGHGIDHEDVLLVNNNANPSKDSRIVLRNHSRTSYFIQSSNTPGSFSPPFLAPHGLSLGINAASPIQFWNGNPRAVRLTIDGNGQVGVNTTDPSAILHCHGTDAVNVCSLRLTREGGGGPYMEFGGPANVNEACSIQFTVNDGSANTLGFSDGTGAHLGRLSLRADVGIGSFADICGCLHVRTQTSNRDAFVIDPSWGCIGIGTKTMEALLDIHDYPEYPDNATIMIHSNRTSNIAWGGLAHPSTEQMMLQYTGGGGKDLEFWRYASPGWYPQLSLKRVTGYVGIGTADPSGTLHVYDPTINSKDVLQLTSEADNATDYLGISFTTAIGGAGPHAAIRCINGPLTFDAGLSFYTTTTSGPPEGLTERVHINHLGHMRIGPVFASDPGAHPLLVHTAVDSYGIHAINSITGSGLSLIPSTQHHTVGTALLDLVNATPVSQSSPSGGSRLIIAARSDGTIRFTNQNSNADFIFQHPADASSIMIIKNDQNVGIGEGFHDPGARLHIRSRTGDTTPTQNLLQLDTDTQTSCGMKFKCSDPSGAIKEWDLFCSNGIENQGWGVYDRSQSVYRFVIDGSYGKVGIGTTDPKTALHVHTADGTSSYITFTNQTTGNGAQRGLQVGSAMSGAHAVVWNKENTSLHFATNDTARMVIDSSGNVGIGTQDPSGVLLKLDGGPANAWGYPHYGPPELGLEGERPVIVFNDNTETGTNAKAIMYDDNMLQFSHGLYSGNWGNVYDTRVTDMVITDAGKVGIGTDTPQEVLDLGSGTMNRGLTWAANNTSQYATIWTEYSTGNLVLGTNVHGAGTSTGSVASWTGTAGMAAIEVFSASGDIAFYTAPSAALTKDVTALTSQRMIITGDGKVGIGTINPQAQLDVSGDVSVIGNVGVGTSVPQVQLQISETGGGEFCMQKVSNSIVKGNKLGDIFFAGSDADGVTDRHNGASILAQAQENWTSTDFGTDLIFRVADKGTSSLQERMRINSQGFVGIGTYLTGPDPSANLHVVGDTKCDGNLYVAKQLGGGVQHSYTLRFTDSNGKDLDLYMNKDGGARIGTSDPSGSLILQHNGAGTGAGTAWGGVGIGAGFDGGLTPGHPGAALFVRGREENTIQVLKSLGQLCLLNFQNSGSGAYEGCGSVNDTFVIYTNNTAQQTIDASGRVGIGITSPNRRLSIGGDSVIPARMALINTHLNSSTVIDMENDAADVEFGIYGGAGDAFQIWTGTSGAASSRLWIETDGRVGIAGAPETGINLHIDDPITTTKMRLGGTPNVGPHHIEGHDQFHQILFRGYPTGEAGGYNFANIMSFTEYGGDFHWYKKNGSILKGLMALSGERLGIGTMNPYEKLHVDGDMVLGARSTHATNDSYSVLQAREYTLSEGLVDGINSRAGNTLNIRAGIGTGAGINGDINFYTEASTVVQGNSIPHGPGSAKLTILSTGNVGIGTTTPKVPFEVKVGNDVLASIGGTISAGKYSGLHFGYFEPANTLYRKTALVFERTDYGVGSTARGKIHFLMDKTDSSASVDSLADSVFTIDESGNVGVGTSQPQEVLDLGNATMNRGLCWASGPLYHYATIWTEYSSGDLVLGSKVHGLGSSSLGMYASWTGTAGMCAIKLDFDTGNIDFYAEPPAALTKDVTALTSKRMTILGNGNVGIGTQDPSAALHIVAQPGEPNGQVRIEGPSPLLRYVDNNASSGYKHGTIQFWDGHFQIGGNEDNWAWKGTPFTIHQNGNVGIGNSAPQAQLDVSGGAAAYATTRALLQTHSALTLTPHASDSTQLNIGALNPSNTKGIIGMQVTNYDATSQWHLALNPFGGNIGINTHDPSYQLHICKHVGMGGDSTLCVQEVGGAEFIIKAAGTGTVIGHKNAKHLWFTRDVDAGSANADMVIRDDGNVGINTGGLAEVTLEVNGVTADSSAVVFGGRSDGGNGNNRRFNLMAYADGGGAGYGGGIKIQTRSTTNIFHDVMDINSDGQLRVPNIPGSGASIPALGYSGGILYYYSSSIKYKKNIVDIEVDTSKIYNLRPVSFDDKASGERNFGLIAEEVYKEVPELVVLKEEEPDSIVYANLSVLLLAEVKKLRARVEQLEAKMAQQI